MEGSGCNSSPEHPAPSLCRSAPDLLYPLAPDPNEKILLWLDRSASSVMSPPSETHSDDCGSLEDSAYELIDTDEESRDGNATESIASTDFGRPDDVASLADTEQSDDDVSDSDRSPTAGHVPYTFTASDGPDHTPIIGQSAAFVDDADRSLAHSIEFEEPLSLGDENVSVKHTVADFNEEETAKIVENLRLRNPPKRLVATIRQTMTRQGLSTKEALRILYVGCHTAKQDIIRKIGSSVAASIGHGLRAGSLDRPSQLYNVVPITSFGSEKPPEVELMQSSGYQIKVEDLTTAMDFRQEDKSEKDDMLRLIIDEHCTYRSIRDESGFVVEPAWELPHVAIFYCSENDTDEMKRARTIAKTFMIRHRVPSIFISHKRTFDRVSGSMMWGQHPIHMCLESRDGPRNVIHQRLPIDLDSFKTIDARQMNRNLAYLTGLHEPLEKALNPACVEKTIPHTLISDHEKPSHTLSESVHFIFAKTFAEWRALLPVMCLLLSVVAAVFTGTLKNKVSSGHSVSINGNLTVTEPMSVISTSATTTMLETPVSLMTATETRTATKTITIIKSETPVSNSLALKPSMELEKVGEKSQGQTAPSTEEKTTVCNAVVVGDREILIRIPSATKLSWLSREAMSVNVSRDSETVETERVYTTHDGIVLQFTKKDARGILNITIITTRKPKINETFKVDFGSNWKQDFLELLSNPLYQRLLVAQDTVTNALAQLQNLGGEALSASSPLTEIARHCLERARMLTTNQAAESKEQVTKVVKALSTDLAKWSAIVSKAVGTQINNAKDQLDRGHEELRLLQAQRIQEPWDDILLQAQIHSKLYWLKLQGRLAEYREYESRAAKATKQRRKDSSEILEKAPKRTHKENHGKAKSEKKSCRRGGKVKCGS